MVCINSLVYIIFVIGSRETATQSMVKHLSLFLTVAELAEDNEHHAVTIAARELCKLADIALSVFPEATFALRRGAQQKWSCQEALRRSWTRNAPQSGQERLLRTRGFRGFEGVGQFQDGLGAGAFLHAMTGSLHDLWPPIATA
jgi:hypothetical protein